MSTQKCNVTNANMINNPYNDLSIPKQPPQQTLGEVIKQPNDTKWGFRIYRCTYESQERWDKFLSLIKADAMEFLEKDSDLWDSSAWDVVEDEVALGSGGEDGDEKDWKEVRAFHDAWVLGELEKEPAEERMDEGRGEYEYEREGRIEREAIALRVNRYEFFIFADEASVNSVVDGDAKNVRGAQESYYITLVQSGLVPRWNEDWDEDAGEEEPEFDEEDLEQRSCSLQRFKA